MAFNNKGEALKNVTSQSPGSMELQSVFRLGDKAQFPLAKEFGDLLAELNDAVCDQAACQPGLCDSRQGASVLQIYDDSGRRYIVSRERSPENHPVSFRIARMQGDHLDTSFGDRGMVRYFAPDSGFSEGLSEFGVGYIHNNRLILAGTAHNKVQLIEFPLDHFLSEASYRVFNPGISGTPLAIGLFLSRLLLVTLQKDSAGNTWLAGYTLGGLRKSEDLNITMQVLREKLPPVSCPLMPLSLIVRPWMFMPSLVPEKEVVFLRRIFSTGDLW